MLESAKQLQLQGVCCVGLLYPLEACSSASRKQFHFCACLERLNSVHILSFWIAKCSADCRESLSELVLPEAKRT